MHVVRAAFLGPSSERGDNADLGEPRGEVVIDDDDRRQLGPFFTPSSVMMPLTEPAL